MGRRRLVLSEQYFLSVINVASLCPCWTDYMASWRDKLSLLFSHGSDLDDGFTQLRVDNKVIGHQRPACTN